MKHYTIEFECIDGMDLLYIKRYVSLSVQVKEKREQERATNLPAWECTSKQDTKRKQRTYKEGKEGLISKESWHFEVRPQKLNENCQEIRKKEAQK